MVDIKRRRVLIQHIFSAKAENQVFVWTKAEVTGCQGGREGL